MQEKNEAWASEKNKKIRAYKSFKSKLVLLDEFSRAAKHAIK